MTAKTPAEQKAPAAQLDPKARLSFEQLDPLPALPPATQPADRPLAGDALKHYQAGLDFARLDQYSDAVDEFEAAAKADPQAFEPRLELGRAAMQSGLFDQAHDALQAAVSLRSREPRAHYLLGLLNYLRENDKAALSQLRYSLALFEQDADRVKPLFYLALVLERQGYYQATVDVAIRFEALLAKHPQPDPVDPRWRQVVASQAWKVPAARASCLRKLGQPAKAVHAYDAALKLNPNRPEVQLALAETLIDVGDMRRAVTLAEAILAKDRHNASALAILAATLASQGQMSQLQDRLLSMVRAKPSDLVLAQRSAAIFLKFGRYDAALDVLLLAYDAADEPAALHAAMLQVVLAESDFTPAWQQLARLLKEVGPDEQGSLLSLRDSLQINPALRSDAAANALLAKAGDDRPKLLALAVLAEMTDRSGLSEQALRRILQDHPDDALVSVMLAERLIDQCRWEDAIAFLRPQVEKHKDEAAFYRLLGMAYDGLDDLKPAMNSFYEAIRRDKRDVQAMWQAAQINDRFGQSEPAVSIYQAIVAIKVDFWPAHLALVRGYLLMGQQPVALEHARKLRELFPDVPEVDLCLLMAESGKPIPRADRIAPLLARHEDDPALLRAIGEAYLQEGRLPQALDALNRLLAQESGDQDGRLLLGTALARRMDYDLARDVVRSLLVEHPNRRLWQFAEAELLLQSGKPADAIPIFQQLLAGPWDAEQKQAILDRLIFAWGYAGQYDAAIDYLRQGLVQSPKDRTLQTRLLGVLISAERRDQAIDVLRAWRKVEPDDPLLARLEEHVLVVQGADQAAAVMALKDWPRQQIVGKSGGPAGTTAPAKGRGSSSSAPENPPTNRDIALLAGSLDPAAAATWLTSRAWLSQTDITAASLAAVAARQGRHLEAAELQRLTGSDDVEDLAQQAQWLFLAGRRAQAELLVMPQIDQKNAEMAARVRRLASSYYKQLGLDRLSVKATADVYAANKDPGRAIEYANDLAYIWSESGMNLPQAEDLARMAVAGEPTNAAYLDTYGWVCYKMGRFQEALVLLQRAVSIPTEGSDPVVFDHLGDTLWHAGKRDQALAAWRRSAELYRDELKTDSQRPDLSRELQAVERKIQAVQSHRQPAVATWAGHRAKRPS